MSQEYDEGANGEESGVTGPGAPTPVAALEVSCFILAKVPTEWY